MTVPAVGFHACIIVALVTEIFLVGMALHTGILKADPYLLTLRIHIPPVAIPQGPVPQVIEQLHVRGHHELLALNTLLLGHLLDLWRIQLGLRLGSC